MSFRPQSSLFLLALGLTAGACADVRVPDQQPNEQADVDVRPTFGSGSQPRLCTIDAAAIGDWQSAEGPRETLPHRLAATPGALFVASPLALRRSSDGGQSFELLESPTPGHYPGPMVGLGDTLFVGTDLGAVRSEDGGETWLSASAGLDGGVIGFHRGKSLLARSTAGSLFRWSPVDVGWEEVESGSFYSAGVAASDGKTVLVDTGNGVLRSTDLAAWSLVTGLEAWGYKDLLIAEELGLAITASGEIRRSADAGVSWLPAQQSPIELGEASRVTQHGDAMFALTSNGVARSSDGGASWGIALAEPPAVGVPEMAESSDLFAVELGEISVTKDGGATWSAAASFTDSTPVAFGKVGDWLLTSTAAAGVFVSSPEQAFQATDAEGYYLRDVETEDGVSYLLFSQRPAQSPTYGMSWAALTHDGGESFEALPLPSTGDTPGRAFETFAVDGEVVLAGGVDAFSEGAGPGVWASPDGGESWSRASEGLPELGFSDGASYPAVLSLVRRGDTVFALLAGRGVFQTSDQGQSWRPVGSLPTDAAGALDDLLVTGDSIYVASHGGQSPLWRFDGKSWVAAAAGGLPAAPFITSFTAVGGTLIAAVQSDSGADGVYLSNDHGATWQSLGLDQRLRAVFVDGETLWAGVEGQGSYSLDIGACR